ncbi:hypothetical protein BVRB_2g036520 [Beta vulgaris subsp. vulgaris]|nr:hypothetical protein BVRB_2g036520 [Beta vulgaris subsp. vulgaris]
MESKKIMLVVLLVVASVISIKAEDTTCEDHPDHPCILSADDPTIPHPRPCCSEQNLVCRDVEWETDDHGLKVFGFGTCKP